MVLDIMRREFASRIKNVDLVNASLVKRKYSVERKHCSANGVMLNV